MSIWNKIPFFKYGTIDYQVKYYIEKYSNALKRGLTKREATRLIMEFYLQNESQDRRMLMEEKFETYVKNIDLLIHQIMCNYFYFDKFKTLPLSEGISQLDNIALETNHLLFKYKQIYQIN